MIFESQARQDFEVKSIVSSEMQSFLSRCASIYEGRPDWANQDIKTINFAKAVCSETARLTMLGTSIKVNGKNSESNARSEWLQGQVDKVFYDIRNWVEYACAYGTIVLKPNGESVNAITPNRYMVTATNGTDITGMVFVNKVATDYQHFYTRLEYHRFMEDGAYVISNKCYLSETEESLGDAISVELTPWSHLSDEVTISNLVKPLYSVLRMPGANAVDIDSPLRMPIFADAIEELRDLDIAYSRNAHEIFESRRIVLMDADTLIPNKGTQTNVNVQKNTREVMELPEFVRNVTGSGSGDFYHEINPLLNTQTRLEGINALLSQLGYKCGYSNGYFVFNQRTGMVTATQVEAEDRRTLQLVKDIRDQVEKCLINLIYALDKFADLYDLAPVGEYEINCDFGDLTYNREEDRARWFTYVSAGLVPAWQFFVKFEGMTEEEAKVMVEEAQGAGKEESLFQEE